MNVLKRSSPQKKNLIYRAKPNWLYCVDKHIKILKSLKESKLLTTLKVSMLFFLHCL